MILAAGFGTRLRPFTYLLPKPMVPICNRPLIGWIIEHAMAAGVREFVVNVHHLPEAIERYLPAAFPESRFEFSREEEILGTGGGVRKVRSLLEGDEDFFLANGDTIQRPPLQQLRAARRAADALAALTLRHPPQGDKYTAVWLDGNRITGFGQGTGEPLMFSGSHCISRRVFQHLPEKPFSGMVEDVYIPRLNARDTARDTLAGVAFDDPLWFDIGTPQRYLGATRAMRESLAGARPLLHESARVSGSAQGSVVGARSVVEGEIADSLVWDDCHLAAGVRLVNCIVGHGVELARGQYENAMICADDPAIPAEYERMDGVVVVPFAA
jgi:NDP-sugar pyrophosphorylase family protein